MLIVSSKEKQKDDKVFVHYRTRKQRVVQINYEPEKTQDGCEQHTVCFSFCLGGS